MEIFQQQLLQLKREQLLSLIHISEPTRLLRIWYGERSGEKIWSSENHPSTVSAVEWVTDQELSTACYGRVTFFNTSSGKENERLQWQGSLVSLALSPDGNVVACGSQDKSVHFCRRSNGQDSMMSGYPWKPSELAFSHDSNLLATGGGEDITVWSFEGNGPEGTTPGVLEFH